MKTKMQNRVKMVLAGVFACLVLGSSAMDATPLGEFKILKKRNGIDLYYRWMRMPEGNEVRQMKAILEIKGSPEDVLDLLKDEKRALDWMPSAEHYRNLTQINGPEWASYMQFAIPWPFADQDCIMEYSVKKHSEEEVQIDFLSNPDYLSPVEGVGRMKDIVGSIVVHSMPNGKSMLECYFLSTKRSRIPVWVTEPIVTGSLLGLMESLRDELTEV